MSSKIIAGAALVALLAGCAAAQSVVSRADAEVASGTCTRCGALGDLELFDAPLYTDCDAILLESLFDGAVYGTHSPRLTRGAGLSLSPQITPFLSPFLSPSPSRSTPAPRSPRGGERRSPLTPRLASHAQTSRARPPSSSRT